MPKSPSETVTWQAVALSETSGRTIVAEGATIYDPAEDIVVQEQGGTRDDSAECSMTAAQPRRPRSRVSRSRHAQANKDNSVAFPYSIRQAVEANIDTLVDFTLRKAAEAEGVTLSVEAAMVGVRAAFGPQPLATYWVALAEHDAIVASTSIVKEWSNSRRRRRMILGEVQVTFGCTPKSDLVLLDAGARPDLRGLFEETALHWAAAIGDAGLVERLLQKGAPADVKDQKWDATPIGWALHGWGEPPPGNHGQHREVVAQLVRAGAVVEASWLAEAQSRGRAERVSALRGEL